MRQILLPLIAMIWSTGLWAQITVTKATFPKVGDTLKTVFDGVPSGVDISTTGPEQAWNFSKLQGLTRSNTLSAASSTSSQNPFSKAEMISHSPSVGKYYLRTSDTKIEYLGMEGEDPFGMGLKVQQKFSPPLIERRTPLNYKDKKTNRSSSTLSFASDDLPRSLINYLPIRPDSLRFRIKLLRQDVVDSWGILTIPGGDYEVLREKRTEITETFLDSKISPLPWLDISDVVDENLLPIGKDTSVQYYFFAEDEVEPIAIVQADPRTNTALSVEYKANNVQTNINYVNRGKADFLAYPNPAIEDVRFEFLNLPRGEYTLTIYNILGVEVWSKDYLINTDKTVKVDLADFRKGTYLYSLANEKGKTITTKRLIILRP